MPTLASYLPPPLGTAPLNNDQAHHASARSKTKLSKIISCTGASLTAKVFPCFTSASLRQPSNSSNIRSKLSKIKDLTKHEITKLEARSLWSRRRIISRNALEIMSSGEKLKFAKTILSSSSQRSIEEFSKQAEALSISSMEHEHKMLLADRLGQRSGQQLLANSDHFAIDSMKSSEKIDFLKILLKHTSPENKNTSNTPENLLSIVKQLKPSPEDSGSQLEFYKLVFENLPNDFSEFDHDFHPRNLNSEKRLELAISFLSSLEKADRFVDYADQYDISSMNYEHKIKLADKLGERGSYILIDVFDRFNIPSLNSDQQLGFLDIFAKRVSVDEIANEDILKEISKKIALFTPTEMSVEQQIRFSEKIITHFPNAFYDVSDQINFSSMDENTRIKLVEDLSEKLPNSFHEKFKDFRIPEDRQLYFIRKAVAKNNIIDIRSRSTSFDAAQFYIDAIKPEERFEIAKQLFHNKGPGELLINISKLKLTDEQIKKIYPLFINRNQYRLLAENIDKFRLSPDEKFDLVKKLLHKDPHTLSIKISNFNLSENEQFMVLKKILSKETTAGMPLLAKQHLNISNFNLSNDHLLEIIEYIFNADNNISEILYNPYNLDKCKQLLNENQKNQIINKLMEKNPGQLISLVDSLDIPEENRKQIIKKLFPIPGYASALAENIHKFDFNADQWIDSLLQYLENPQTKTSTNAFIIKLNQLLDASFQDEPGNNINEHKKQLAREIIEKLSINIFTPKHFNREKLISATIKLDEETKKEIDSIRIEDFPLVDTYEDFFERIDFKDDSSTFYLDPKNLIGDSNLTLDVIKETFIEKLRVIDPTKKSSKSNEGAEDIYRISPEHREDAQIGLIAISNKLKKLLESESPFFQYGMLQLIPGFQACETAQMEAIRNTFLGLVYGQNAPETSLDAQVKHAISDAKMTAFHKSQNTSSVHLLSAAMEVIDKTVGLPNVFSKFRDRVRVHEDPIATLGQFFVVFTRDFLIDSIASKIETKSDRANEINSKERPIKGLDILSWVNEVYKKKGLTSLLDVPYALLKDEFGITYGEPDESIEFHDQLYTHPYDISRKTVEKILVEMGYLQATEHENSGQQASTSDIYSNPDVLQ